MAELLVGTEQFWANEQEELITVLYPEIQEAVDVGVIAGADPIIAAGLVADFDLVNEAAEAFAKRYSFELVTQINNTTASLLQQYTADWIASGQHLNELTDGLRKDPLTGLIWGQQRARLIAMTETTRAFAQGNMLMWQSSGHVVGTTWHSVRDNQVDSLCEMNENAGVVKLGEAYPSGHSAPPAHPGCRCYLAPVLGEKKPESFKPLTFADIDDVSIYGGEVWGDIGASSRQLEALESYQGTAYRYVNDGLRSGGLASENWQVQYLDELVQLQPTVDDLKVWRGVDLDALVGKNVDLWDLETGVVKLEDLVHVGMQFDDLGFTSTSLNQSTAADFIGGKSSALIEINVPTGTPAAYVDGIVGNDWEYELLLGRGSQFKIASIDTVKVVDTEGIRSTVNRITVDIVGTLPKALIAVAGRQHKADDRSNYWVWKAGDLKLS